jgi:hypothetical protein
MTEDGEHTSTSAMYTCPFVNRCDCPVKFRVVTSATDVFLYTHGKHTADSHSSENTAGQDSRSRLSLKQQAAVQRVVRTHPMSSSSEVRRSLNLTDTSARDRVYISAVSRGCVRRYTSRNSWQNTTGRVASILTCTNPYVWVISLRRVCHLHASHRHSCS